MYRGVLSVVYQPSLSNRDSIWPLGLLVFARKETALIRCEARILIIGKGIFIKDERAAFVTWLDQAARKPSEGDAFYIYLFPSNQRQFNSILADLRLTGSPAPFRCTIGELTGPATFSKMENFEDSLLNRSITNVISQNQNPLISIKSSFRHPTSFPIHNFVS